MARQGAGFVVGALGILAAGACMVPIPDDASEEANAELARRARLHWIAHEADGFAARAGPAPGAVDGAGDEVFRALRPAYLRFTSGTTAERKGVILGHDAILARLAAANRGLAIGPGDRVLWLLPMAHHFVVSILLYLRYGAAILLPASHLARPVLELASRARGDACSTRRRTTTCCSARTHRSSRSRARAPRHLDRRGPARRDRGALPRALRTSARAGARHHRGRACRS